MEPGVVGREQSGTSDMASKRGELGVEETAAEEGAWDMDQLWVWEARESGGMETEVCERMAAAEVIAVGRSGFEVGVRLFVKGDCVPEFGVRRPGDVTVLFFICRRWTSGFLTSALGAAW